MCLLNASKDFEVTLLTLHILIGVLMVPLFDRLVEHMNYCELSSHVR